MIPRKVFLVSLLSLLGCGALVVVIGMRSVPVVVATNLDKIPMSINGYTATEYRLPEAVYAELKADTHVCRTYRSPAGDEVDLYIGYYGTAKGGRTGHNPYACLPSSGAAILETGNVDLRQDATGKTVPVNYILSRKDGVETVMLHWYQTARSTVVATGFSQNIERLVGRVVKNRNDGAFVRVTASPAKGTTDRKQTAKAFAATVLNMLPAYWPEEH